MGVMNVIFVATGDEMQQSFNSLAKAIEAAEFAPWADGRVFRHYSVDEYVDGFGDVGGELVFECTPIPAEDRW